MRRYPVLIALAFTIAAPVMSSSAPAAAYPPASSKTQFIAFRGHIGGGSRGLFGGARSSSRGRTFLGGRRGRSHALLRSIARALALAYILHLLFGHGGMGILIWLIVIGLVVHLVRRRRRQRYAF
jgi:hypothetical protein